MDPIPTSAADPDEISREESLIEAGSALWSVISDLIGDTVRLAALETRLAGLSLSAMLALAVAGGLLLITAWLLLAAALAVWLTRWGLAWESALIGVAILNVLLCVPVFWLIGRLSRNLLFAATRRHLVPPGSIAEESCADHSTDSSQG